MKKVILKKGKEEAILRLHPWIFSGAIANIDSGTPQDGECVIVQNHRLEFLAQGHYNNGSIAIRILSYIQSDDLQGSAFWHKKLANAFAMRNTIGLPLPQVTNCFRLVHGEGDYLPGLVVDVYDKVAVVQCHSIGMHLQLQLIAEAIVAASNGIVTAVYDKSKESLPGNYARTLENGWRIGTAETPQKVCENGNFFQIDWVTGQKTGFFLDQRDNRQLLGHYAKDKSVLNTFCYTGGFSLYALQGGATTVHSVDVSAKAMTLTEANVLLAGNAAAARHQGFTEDVMPFLKNNTELYDIVIVDPPAFAKTLDKRHNAVQGYKRLNVAALHRVAPGGLFFTFSCSQVIDRALFYHTIVAAALEAGRKARVIHHLSQSPDHPVSIFHPEGSYLKGLVLQVE